MLFSSFEFVYLFLPIAVFAFVSLELANVRRTAFVWLIFASLVYYGWWDRAYLILIGASIALNYLLGLRLQDDRSRGVLVFGIAANLAALGWFKYTGFLADIVRDVTALGIPNVDIVLPIGISFYTFQQIAWLVDCQKGVTRARGLTEYALFVAFFPQLVAGPIVHFREMMPQFSAIRPRSRLSDDLAMGIGLFFLGLTKKVLLADEFQRYADAYFGFVDTGMRFGPVEAALGIMAYSFQLYFDFSAYSDMATGIARMFGIRLPINFNSPYKAADIQEFWRRWHMTLSRFLRDYLYIPLGGSRRGRFAYGRNVMITMLLGGLWHGANWTFVLWGGLHGVALLVHHLAGRIAGGRRIVPRPVGVVLTFVLVALFWVPFRADSVSVASHVYGDLLGSGGILSDPSNTYIDAALFGGPQTIILEKLRATTGLAFAWAGVAIQAITMAVGFAVVWFMPNTAQLFPAAFLVPAGFDDHRPVPLSWRPSLHWALAVAAMIAITFFAMKRQVPFLYFQF